MAVLHIVESADAQDAIRDGRARAFRQAIGLSLRQAGALVGVGKWTVYSWESSRRTPHPAIARAYVSALLAQMVEETP
jgi:DNA-binding transcriptional regulator YiaG